MCILGYYKNLWVYIIIATAIISIRVKSQEANMTPELLLFDNIPLQKPQFSSGGLHTLERLEKWSMKDENLVETFSKRLKLIKVETKLIKSYLKDYNESTKRSMKGIHDFIKSTANVRGKVVGSSAILAHRMIDRYASILPKLQELIASEVYSKNLRDINEAVEITDTSSSSQRETLHRPNQIDKYLSDLSFVNLHAIFGFSPVEMRNGLELGTKYGGFLNAKQCSEIGAHALSRQYYYIAIEWLELAKALAWGDDATIPKDFVSALVEMAIKEHNLALLHETVMNTEDMYIEPIYEGQPDGERKRGRNFLYHVAQQTENIPHKLKLLTRFWGLCSGFKFQTPETELALKCYYETKRHPYLYINPVKTEVLSENPPLFQFYDLLTNGNIEKIKAATSSRFDLSRIEESNDLELTTKYRTSAGTILRYQEMPKLYDYSEIVSGLKLKGASEVAQVVEYTYGRFYMHHTDILQEEEIEKVVGGRVATLLYYLETAEYGGETPFCSAGVNARPVRGSAILWYNLYRNGSVRQNVHHGACPIIHGHKIIINHWIRYNPNWNHYKCSLNQFE